MGKQKNLVIFSSARGRLWMQKTRNILASLKVLQFLMNSNYAVYSLGEAVPKKTENIFNVKIKVDFGTQAMTIFLSVGRGQNHPIF